MLRLGAGTIPPKRLREAVSVCGHGLTVSDLNRVVSEAGAAAGLVATRTLVVSVPRSTWLRQRQGPGAGLSLADWAEAQAKAFQLVPVLSV